MGMPVEFITHVACGSSRLQVFQQEDESYDGYCFGCSTKVYNPYEGEVEGYRPKTKTKTKQDINNELYEIWELGCQGLPDRRLAKESLEHFGIRIGVSGADGVSPNSYHFPYGDNGVSTGYKVGLLELDDDGKKRMWSVGATKKVDLFGWQQAIASGDRRLFITEGEFDAVALYQIIMQAQAGGGYADRVPAVVSIPHGSSGAKADISRVLSKIRASFDEVVLVFDHDEQGEKATEEVLSIAPDFMTVTLPSSDANQCLIDGHNKATFSICKFRAAVPKNTRLIYAEDLHEEAKVPAEFGVSWPWDGLTRLTRGIRTKETIYIGAAQKMGKSEVVNALAEHLMVIHGWKVMLCKPEEANKKSYKMVLNKVAGTNFTDPKIPFNSEAYDVAGKKIEGKLTMLNLYQHVGWESLKLDIIAAAVWGAKAVFIDPLTQLSNGVASGEANTLLQAIAQDLAALALDLDIVVFIFCHLNNPAIGASHDRGGHVLTSQFAGSRAMGRSCNYMIGIEGNKDPDLPASDRDVRTLVLLDDREFGEVGEVKLRWNRQTTLFTEI